MLTVRSERESSPCVLPHDFRSEARQHLVGRVCSGDEQANPIGIAAPLLNAAFRSGDAEFRGGAGRV